MERKRYVERREGILGEIEMESFMVRGGKVKLDRFHFNFLCRLNKVT